MQRITEKIEKAIREMLRDRSKPTGMSAQTLMHCMRVQAAPR